MQDMKLAMNIEPGLFEWGGWFKSGMPSWISPEEYKVGC